MNVLKKLWCWVRWPLAVLVVAYIALVLYRIPAVGEQQRTTEAIAKIQAAKINLSTVMGTNLPPQPYKPENEATVAGLDKNGNGIRDDVELAIFALYPKSAKIRAAELQYAMTEQMFLTDVFNKETWKAVAKQQSRAFACVGDTIPGKDLKALSARIKEVEDLVQNNSERKSAYDKAFDFTTSNSLANFNFCDVDLASLPN
jgi:hypothetical protein